MTRKQYKLQRLFHNNYPLWLGRKEQMYLILMKSVILLKYSCATQTHSRKENNATAHKTIVRFKQGQILKLQGKVLQMCCSKTGFSVFVSFKHFTCKIVVNVQGTEFVLQVNSINSH
ncbi:hypothetical protein FKM82_006392 [Ascaphus truei]